MITTRHLIYGMVVIFSFVTTASHGYKQVCIRNYDSKKIHFYVEVKPHGRSDAWQSGSTKTLVPQAYKGQPVKRCAKVTDQIYFEPDYPVFRAIIIDSHNKQYYCDSITLSNNEINTLNYNFDKADWTGKFHCIKGR